MGCLADLRLFELPQVALIRFRVYRLQVSRFASPQPVTPPRRKKLIRYRDIRIITENPARYARPMDLPAREADPTQTILPKP